MVGFHSPFVGEAYAPSAHFSVVQAALKAKNGKMSIRIDCTVRYELDHAKSPWSGFGTEICGLFFLDILSPKARMKPREGRNTTHSELRKTQDTSP
jgi:hypothetical protein